MSAETGDAGRSAGAPDRASQVSVDNTDWLKTAAIILVAVDHFGHFFVRDDRWWSVFGRLAAPTFFFLIGYAQTRRVPLHWIWLGVILTLLNSWNAGWTWVAPNILLSLAFLRFVRPYAETLLQRYGWVAFIVLVGALVAMLPFAGKIVDYGSEGWLWGLFGLCQRIYVDRRAAADADGAAPSAAPPATATVGHPGLMALVACLIAAAIYVWQEQLEYRFPQLQLAVFILGIGVLSASLYLFRRGQSRIQPPEPIAATLRFIGRHTLEIYAIQLAGSELLIKLVPDLAP